MSTKPGRFFIVAAAVSMCAAGCQTTDDRSDSDLTITSGTTVTLTSDAAYEFDAHSGESHANLTQVIDGERYIVSVAWANGTVSEVQYRKNPSAVLSIPSFCGSEGYACDPGSVVVDGPHRRVLFTALQLDVRRVSRPYDLIPSATLDGTIAY